MTRSAGQEVVGWSLAGDALPGCPQPGRRAGWGAVEDSLSLRHLFLVVVCCFPTVFASLLLHLPLLTPFLLLHGIFWLSSKRRLTEYLSFPLSNSLVDFTSYNSLVSLFDIHRDFLAAFLCLALLHLHK